MTPYFTFSTSPFENIIEDGLTTFEGTCIAFFFSFSFSNYLTLIHTNCNLMFIKLTKEVLIIQGSMRLTFCIGGPYGHGPLVRERADMAISLSSLVLNHQVALIVLLEQIYRFQICIYILYSFSLVFFLIRPIHQPIVSSETYF